MFSLTLFQASVLCIGASFVFTFIIFAVMIDKRVFKVIHINRNKSNVFDVNGGRSDL
jgi:hypothetical protein